MILGLGFSFNNRHSSEFNIVSLSDDRSLLPEKRRNEVAIPGRHGAYDYGGNTYEKRVISVNLSLISKTLPDLRERLRAAASWLSGAGRLIFDDELDKAYNAKVYAPLPLAQIIACGISLVPFDCEPFAYGAQKTLPLQRGMNAISYTGTAETPTLIIIRNPNAFAVSSIVVTAVQQVKV